MHRQMFSKTTLLFSFLWRPCSSMWMHGPQHIRFYKKLKEIDVFFFITAMLGQCKTTYFFFIGHIKFATCSFCNGTRHILVAKTYISCSASDLNCLMTDTDIKVLKALQKRMYDLNCIFILQAGSFGKGHAKLFKSSDSHLLKLACNHLKSDEKYHWKHLPLTDW